VNGPYVSNEGDVWIERGDAPWPRIQRAARMILDEMGYDEPGYPMRYEGIEQGVRVSDNNEADGVHAEETGCDCCRTVVAHHFRAEDPL
jgi:hypothetical protein